MDEEIWTFGRNGQQLEIKRAPTDEGILLVVTGDGSPRSYFFPGLERLVVFQSDFEKFLLGTGWTFIGFSPDRRTGHDRRHFSRLITDRRRWWTDGLGASQGRESEQRERRQRPRQRSRQT